MPLVIADRVRETSTSIGTGNFTLAGAVTGFQAFSSVLASADTTYYTIADQSGPNWEVGIGTFTAPSTLARTTILSSSNAGSAVTFTTGIKDVFIGLPASITSTFVTLTGTQTLTNKRVTPRIVSITDAATITPTGDTADQYEVTALAQAATIAAPSGTPTDGQKLILRIKDNGTARALTWTTTSGAYRAVSTSLPTTTTLSKVLYVGCIYNSQDTFWDVVAVAQQA